MSEGHVFLQNNNKDVSVFPAKQVTEELLDNFEVICVDEAQRIYSGVIDLLLEQVEQNDKKCIFSYDYRQSLSRTEMKRNNPRRLNEIEGFQQFELTDNIRTNKEISSFIRTMMSLNDLPRKRVSYDNIDIIYANTTNEADAILRLYISKEYTFISITPSQYVVNEIDHFSTDTNSHLVIGQEFDNVVVIIDANFEYNNDGVLKGNRHPNPDYLFDRLLYQNVTRARSSLCLIVLANPEVFRILINIKNHSLDLQEL